MKVRELLTKLESVDPDLVVFFEQVNCDLQEVEIVAVDSYMSDDGEVFNPAGVVLTSGKSQRGRNHNI